MERQVEGQRGLELRISNAQFSKLIKMGREQGKTPQRVGQALFDQAYEAACLGKGAKDQVAAAGKLADAMEDDLRTQLDDARARLQKTEEERADLWRRNRELASERNVDNAVLADLRAQLDQAQKTIASKDAMLLDQAKEIREANATIEQLRQRIEEKAGAPVNLREIAADLFEAGPPSRAVKVSIEDLTRLLKGEITWPAHDAAKLYNSVMPEDAQVPVPPKLAPVDLDQERKAKVEGLQRLIRARHACGLSKREIAKELGLTMEAVRQVLG